jgi:hypothetical protein
MLKFKEGTCPTVDDIVNDVMMGIVHDFLKKNGFDGLFNGELNCSCHVDSLGPCGEIDPGECRAGYAGPCTCGNGCDFDIGTKEWKEEAERRLKEGDDLDDLDEDDWAPGRRKTIPGKEGKR